MVLDTGYKIMEQVLEDDFVQDSLDFEKGPQKFQNIFGVGVRHFKDGGNSVYRRH